MGEPRALGRHRQRADAGIAEQVQRLAALAQPLAHPRPLRRHVGEEGEVAERRALGAEAHLLPAQLPALARHRPGELPAAAALLVRAGDELAVGVPFGRGRRPHRLRLGADEAVAAVALELAAIARIDQPVIGPGLGDERGEASCRLDELARRRWRRARGPASIFAPAARTCVQRHRVEPRRRSRRARPAGRRAAAAPRHSSPGPSSFRGSSSSPPWPSARARSSSRGGQPGRVSASTARPPHAPQLQLAAARWRHRPRTGRIAKGCERRQTE